MKTTIPPLVSFTAAKQHLHILTNDLDKDIDFKLKLASRIVMGHCKLTSIPSAWVVPLDEVPDDEPMMVFVDDVGASPPTQYYADVPSDVQAAILLVLGSLFTAREAESSVVLSETVIDLLRPFRDPTFA